MKMITKWPYIGHEITINKCECDCCKNIKIIFDVVFIPGTGSVWPQALCNQCFKLLDYLYGHDTTKSVFQCDNARRMTKEECDEKCNNWQIRWNSIKKQLNIYHDISLYELSNRIQSEKIDIDKLIKNNEMNLKEL